MPIWEVGMVAMILVVAVLELILSHYAFSFQRFTLGIARNCTPNVSNQTTLQVMMTPVKIGLLGWSANLSLFVMPVLLTLFVAWPIGILYLAISVGSGLLPLFQFRSHFANLARVELQKHLNTPGYPLVELLLEEVERAEVKAIA